MFHTRRSDLTADLPSVCAWITERKMLRTWVIPVPPVGEFRYNYTCLVLTSDEQHRIMVRVRMRNPVRSVQVTRY